MKSQNSSLAHQDLSSFDEAPGASTRAQGAVVSPAHERAPSTRSSGAAPSRRRPERAHRDGANPFGPDVILPE